MVIHILTDDKGRRYCRDGQFREFALFGTGPTCVKVYKRQSWADKVIYRHNDECERQGIGSKILTWTIYHLHEGDTMDAFGNIQRKQTNEPTPQTNYLRSLKTI